MAGSLTNGWRLLVDGRRLARHGVLRPFDGEDATIGNGTMCGFAFDTAEQAAAFHAARGGETR